MTNDSLSEIPDSVSLFLKHLDPDRRQSLPHVTQFCFDFSLKNPNIHSDLRSLKPFGYLFQGILMQWFREHQQEMGNRLHGQRPPEQKFFFHEYAIQMQRLQFHQSISHADLNRPILRGIINCFDTGIADSILAFMFSTQNRTLRFGQEDLVITQVELKQISLLDLVEHAKNTSHHQVQFLTPTAFSRMGLEIQLRIPLPTSIFGTLSKQWDNLFAGTTLTTPKGFFEWINTAISISSYNIQTQAWPMGKNIKLTGATGWVKYAIHPTKTPMTNKYEKWVDILLHFGEYANVGERRTAGFGHFCVDQPPVNPKGRARPSKKYSRPHIQK